MTNDSFLTFKMQKTILTDGTGYPMNQSLKTFLNIYYIIQYVTEHNTGYLISPLQSPSNHAI